MQIKIWNTDWTIFKNLDRAKINSISVKNWWSIETQTFEKIIWKYISFEISNKKTTTPWLVYENRFAIWKVASYSFSNNRYTYQIEDILKDFRRWYLSGGYESGWPTTLDVLVPNIANRYNATRWWSIWITNITSVWWIAGNYTYTNKRNCYDALKELFDQIPSNYTYMLQFSDKWVSNCITLAYWVTGNNYKLYLSKWTYYDFYITSLSYNLTMETLYNYIFYIKSDWTLGWTISDATSIAKYWQRVKELRLSTNDGSELAKAQKYLDQYKNPNISINNITLSSLWRTANRLFVWDTIEIMSEWVKDDIFVWTQYLIQDITYNWSQFWLVVWDIVNRDYLTK